MGINWRGSEVANPAAVFGRTLPWLQDTAEAQVWDRWEVEYRDFRILDAQNRVVAVFNLTSHDLAQVAHRQTLKGLLLSAAATTDLDGNGLPDHWELHHFGLTGVDPQGDADLDGVSNYLEFIFGTDPTNPADFPRLDPARVQTNSGPVLSLRYRRPAGGMWNYLVEHSPDLAEWFSGPSAGLGNETRVRFDGSGTAEVTVTVPSESPAQFLRVRAQQR